MGSAGYPRVLPGTEAMRAGLLRLVDAPPLRQVCAGSGQLSQGEQGLAERIMGLQEERRMLHALGQALARLSQRPRRV
jgi:hypothetical protein